MPWRMAGCWRRATATPCKSSCCGAGTRPDAPRGRKAERPPAGLAGPGAERRRARCHRDVVHGPGVHRRKQFAGGLRAVERGEGVGRGVCALRRSPRNAAPPGGESVLERGFGIVRGGASGQEAPRATPWSLFRRTTKRKTRRHRPSGCRRPVPKPMSCSWTTTRRTALERWPTVWRRRIRAGLGCAAPGEEAGARAGGQVPLARSGRRSGLSWRWMPIFRIDPKAQLQLRAAARNADLVLGSRYIGGNPGDQLAAEPPDPEHGGGAVRG